MRIAYFTDTFLPQVNGVTNTLGKLDAYLEKNSVERMFFAPEYPESGSGESRDTVKRFKSVSLPVYPECRLSIPLYVHFSKLVDEFNPELIHLVTPLGIGWAGLKYAREREIPLVASFHTYFDAYLKYYRLETMEDAVWNYFRWFHNFCSINFCPSTDTLRLLEEKGVANLRIWSRGIDTDKFSPGWRSEEFRKRFDARDKMLFLYVGRVAAEKDLDVLLECMNPINSLYPGRASFVITGDGPYSAHMKKNSPSNVHFTGYLRGMELAEAYASADVFVFPSSTETFGNVVLEAMASGLPVIAADAGGVKDSIIDNDDGFLCQARNAAGFTRAMESFIKDPGLAVSMGARARRHTLSKSWDSIFAGLLSDYGDACGVAAPNKRKTA